MLTPDNAGHAAWVYTSSFGGGLVDGDHQVLNIHVCPGATAWVSTQASTKVYRSIRGTSTQVHARVEPGACLVLAPDPVVCFASSRYRQVQNIELAAGASLVLVDWLTSGRHVSGERWAFEEYHAQVRVRQDGRLIVHDALALRAVDGALEPRLGRWNILGTVVLLGSAVQNAAAEIAAQVARDPVVRRADQIVTATVVGDGCLLRIAGTSVERVASTVRTHLRFVRRLLGDDPWARKW